MKRKLVWLAGVGVLAGCAHGIPRDEVTQKVRDREARVQMGQEDVKTGDQVLLVQRTCNKTRGLAEVGVLSSSCTEHLLGEGVVTQLLENNSATVAVNPGVSFHEGTLVRKKP